MIRSPFCGHNLAKCVELIGEYLPCYSNKFWPVSRGKCPHDHSPTDKAYLSHSKVTNISKSFTHKMAAETSWHRQGTNLRHCHIMYTSSLTKSFDTLQTCVVDGENCSCYYVRYRRAKFLPDPWPTRQYDYRIYRAWSTQPPAHEREFVSDELRREDKSCCAATYRPTVEMHESTNMIERFDLQQPTE